MSSFTRICKSTEINSECDAYTVRTMYEGSDFPDQRLDMRRKRDTNLQAALMRCPVEERKKQGRKCNSRLKHEKTHAPDSISNIKILHHTDLRGHPELLGQMFIIILKLLSLWRNGKLLIVGRDMAHFIFMHVTGFHLR